MCDCFTSQSYCSGHYCYTHGKYALDYERYARKDRIPFPYNNIVWYADNSENPYAAVYKYSI